MKRVCLVVNGLSYGGVEQILYNYLQDYDKSKYYFDIIAQREISIEKDIYRFSEIGFNILFVTHKRKSIVKNYFEIRKILKNGNYDIIHANMSYMNFYVLRFANKYGIKTRINHYHNVFNGSSLKKMIYFICNRLCNKYSTYNLFCSYKVADYFGKTSKESSILPNAIDIKRFEFDEFIREETRNRIGITKDIFVIGHIGRFTNQKNHSFIIDVFDKYHKKNSKSKLLLCGDGELLEMSKKKCEDLELQDSVIFLEPTSKPEIYYNAMDYFLFPSVFEGLGITMVEAQINGLSCTCSEVIPEEAILSNRVSIISLKESSISWANTITQKKYDRKIKINCSRYDIDRYKQCLYSIYEQKQKVKNNECIYK